MHYYNIIEDHGGLGKHTTKQADKPFKLSVRLCAVG